MSKRARPNFQWQMLLPGVSHANHTARQAESAARMTAAICGQPFFTSSEPSNPFGVCLKMLLESSSWRSTLCVLTWKTRVTPSGRLLFQLAPLTRSISEHEFGFWPTPTAQSYKGGRLSPRTGVKSPLKNSYPDFCSLVLGQRYAHPDFTEHLMGYPTGWTVPND